MTRKTLGHNPVKNFRINSGYSQVALCKKINLSPQALYMTEKGVYEKVPDNLKLFMISRDWDWTLVEREYAEFREMVARDNALLFIDKVFLLPPSDARLNPIKEFRLRSLAMNPNATCLHFLINPGIYRRLEESVDYANIPDNIVQAFLKGGLKLDIVEELQERYKEHWEYQRYTK